MPDLVHKLLLIAGAGLIAAGVTTFPWMVLFRLSGDISTFMGMTAILWAPFALLVGIAGGGLFAWRLWPRDLEP